MLIIEIALGIVLGAVLLACLPFVLRVLGYLLLALAVVSPLVFAALLSWVGSNQSQTIAAWIAVGWFGIALLALIVRSQRAAKKNEALHERPLSAWEEAVSHDRIEAKHQILAGSPERKATILPEG